MGRIQTDNILSNWHKLIEDFSTSPMEFYSAVAAALRRRKIPELQETRCVVWDESGVLSPKREYLRMTDGRIIFDLCAAPFGTGFFFSWWLVQRQATWVPLWTLAYLTAAWLLHGWLIAQLSVIMQATRGPLSWFWGSWVFYRPGWLISVIPAGLGGELVLWGLAILLVFTAVALTARSGRSAAEEAMLVIPVMGKAYANLFAPQTYYRIDTAIMFRSAVHAAVLEVIDGLMSKKGLKALGPDDRKPVMSELLGATPSRELEAIGAPGAGITS